MNTTDYTFLVQQIAEQRGDWLALKQTEQVLLDAGEQGFVTVLQGLHHSNPFVRRWCAGFMDHHGDDRCVVGLTEKLLHDPVPYVRREAVHSLGCDRCKDAPLSADRVPLLVQTLQTDSSIAVRREACFQLCEQAPDERVMAEARRILDTESDFLLRKHAHRALYRYDPVYHAQTVATARLRQDTRSTD